MKFNKTDISIIILAILVFGSIAWYESTKNVDTTAHINSVSNNEVTTQEKEYQQGIELIKQSKWHDAAISLVSMAKDAGKYKYSQDLYNYASSHDSADENDYSMASYYLRNFTSSYDGPFKEEILAFKTECDAKAKEQQAAEVEANKIQPGSRKVRIGMSQEEVISSMGGKPYDINRTVSSYGTHEQWCYKGGVYLYFDNGVLTSWQD